METAKSVLDKLLYWIVVALFALMVVVVVWQVFSRQVLGSPATWTDEGARLSFVWLGLFASAFLFGERGHIAVEVMARKFPAGAQRLISLLVELLVLAFALVVLVWGGWRASQNAWNQALSALPFTSGQMYLALPVSGVLMAFYSVFYIVGLANKSLEPYPDVEDDPDLQMDKYTEESRLLPEPDANASDTNEEG